MSRYNRITSPDDVPVQLNVRIPFALRERLIKACDRENVSQSTFIARAIADSLDVEALVK